MTARELLRHVFSWEIAPGVPAEEAHMAAAAPPPEVLLFPAQAA